MGVLSLVTLRRKDSKMAWLGLASRASPADAAVPPHRRAAAPRGPCSHACAEFLAWQRFFVPFQAYLGHGTPTADHFPNFGHFRAAGRAGGLSGSEVRFLGSEGSER